MPTVTVRLPAAITTPQPAATFDCEAETIGEALHALVAQAPRFKQRLYYGGRLLVTVTLNGRHIAGDELTAEPVSDGDRIDLVPPVAGG